MRPKFRKTPALRAKMCAGKKRFSSLADARKARDLQAKLYHKFGLTHYLCPFCQKWHLGH